MMTAAVLLLGLAVGQPAEPDFFTSTTRSIKLPILYKKERATIRDVMLFVSRDQGATWELAANALPTQEAFTYSARDDGEYWFQLVTVDLKGVKDPADLTKEPPAMKMLVDTAPPFVRITDGRRNGEEVVVQWVVEDKFWDEPATKVQFRAVEAGESAPWRDVKLVSASKSGVRFTPGTPGAVAVKVMVQDRAGAKAETMKVIPASGVNPASIRTSLSASTPPETITRPGPGESVPVMPAPTFPTPMLPAPLSPELAPMSPPPVAPPTMIEPSPAPVAPPMMAPISAPPTMPPLSAPPVMTPIATGHGLMTPTPPPAAPPTLDTPAPIASSTTRTPSFTPTVPTSASAPTMEPTRVPVINKLRFDLSYEVEQRGPSGISRVDLWVTRDEGRAWQRWSQHDGRETPIRVALDLPANRKLEGAYGFRLVPISGAGLSDAAPASGEAPEMRVVVDVTPPVIELYQPSSDPHSPDSLVIPWRAADDNFAEEPIAIEWSEQANGPWKPVMGSSDSVVPVSSVVGGPAPRLANTGRFSWRVPANLPTHKVYLKVTARDQAGNTSEVMTPHPVLVDLAKPRARISGIIPAASAVKP